MTLVFESNAFYKKAMTELIAPASTRDAIIDRLKRHGPQSAGAIAGTLDLTAMAVRLQLYDLEREGLVTAEAEPRGRGRPTKLWSLTGKAARIFPDAHQGLAVEMITHLRDLFGEEGLAQVIDRHSQQQLTGYRSALSGLKKLGDRVEALAAARDGEGYMAEVRPDGNDWLLIENHCPICSAAKLCTRLCANELAVFQAALGEDAEVSRESHLLAGSRRCVYRVRAVE
jgi:predicted ArsR family transcriptional regulator